MIKCGVIGCGVIAPTHIEGVNALPNGKVVHLCDIKPDRSRALGEKYGVAKCSVNYHELLADKEVQLVHVCTDHASHAQIVIDALNAGKHVICEKSLGRIPEDLRAMTQTAQAHPELVASGIFQHRFVNRNIALRQLISEQAFGKLLNINFNFCCRRTNEYYEKDEWRGTIAGEGGGILINQAIHHLDQLRFLFGEVAAVSACSGNLTHQGVTEVEDSAAFLLEFTSGLFGVVAATNSSISDWRSLLLINGDNCTMEYTNEKPTFIEASSEELKQKISDALSDDSKEKVVGKSYYGSGHTAQIADVFDAITQHRPPQITLADSANSSSLVLAVYESAKCGGIRIPVEHYC